jgi:transposase InsO family protein
VAFVIDVFARRIVGWRDSSLVDYSDRGSQGSLDRSSRHRMK